MIEAFAQPYCLCSPGVFQSTSMSYVLSFTMIMLSTTSLYNPNVRDKLGLEHFVAMNQGINKGRTSLRSCSGTSRTESEMSPSRFLRMMEMIRPTASLTQTGKAGSLSWEGSS